MDLTLLPSSTTIPRLDLKRQWYLYEHIRQHRRYYLSEMAKPTAATATQSEEASSENFMAPPTPKRPHVNVGSATVLGTQNTLVQCSLLFVLFLYPVIMTGKNDTIELSFMLVGHTKFSPYRPFGLKKVYRHYSVSSLSEFVGVVERSTIGEQNIAQLIEPTKVEFRQ